MPTEKQEVSDEVMEVSDAEDVVLDEKEPIITVTSTKERSEVGVYAALIFIILVVVGASWSIVLFGDGSKKIETENVYDVPTQTVQVERAKVSTETDDPVSDDVNVVTSTPAGVVEKEPVTVVRTSPIVESYSSVPCEDTDGGKVPYVYGEITGATRTVVTDADGTRRYVDGAVRTVKDVCVAAGGTTTFQGETVYIQVSEVFCGDDGRITGNGVDCPLGCKNGACIQEPVRPVVWIRADGQEEMIRKEYGSTVTISWGSQNAVSCSMSSYGVATEKWNPGTIPLSGTKELVVKDTVTSTDFTITCTSSTGYTSKGRVTVYSQREV